MPVLHCLIAVASAALTALLLWNFNPFFALGIAPLTGSAAVLAFESVRLAMISPPKIGKITAPAIAPEISV